LTAHGFFYAPRNKDFAAPAGERPPLVVHSHGGPTGATTASFRPSYQYWTSRGFAVVDVNYGGSTGYGRAYRERLRGQWGVVDVEDCVAAAEFLVSRGEADPDRLCITGGSAGGYTTLCALTFTDVFAAGASHFGLSDLVLFVGDTHKFESRYLDSLVGPFPERRDLYEARSAVHHADRLNCPVIFFQGDEDKIVPPNQAEVLVDALKQKGVPVAYVLFAGEQHGFRKAENIRRSVDGEFDFYSRVFGFDPADELEPVEIHNLD
jgi:dipeptidyl aminopeptidase/acylaminoacyl peptidase